MRTLAIQYLATTALLVCFAAAGCGGDNGTDSDNSANSTSPKKQETAPAPAKPKGLIGLWICNHQQGSVRLDIRSESELTLDGDPARYKRIGDSLQVTADGQVANYPIKLSSDQLLITFPGGQRLAFARSGSAQGANVASADAASGLNDPRYLATTLMNFGSSSGGGSSYSRTTRVVFDGSGRFVVRNETNFSSDAGGRYSNPVTAQGSYRIDGSRVILTFSDGETGVAQIKMRQNDGRITELTYEGNLYGPVP